MANISVGTQIWGVQQTNYNNGQAVTITPYIEIDKITYSGGNATITFSWYMSGILMSLYTSAGSFTLNPGGGKSPEISISGASLIKAGSSTFTVAEGTDLSSITFTNTWTGGGSTAGAGQAWGATFATPGGFTGKNYTVPTTYKAPSNPSITISNITTTSMKITGTWTGGTNSDGYMDIYLGNNKKGTIDDTKKDSVIISGLTPNTLYTIKGILKDKKGPNPHTEVTNCTNSKYTATATPSITGLSSTTTTYTTTVTSNNGSSNLKYEFSIDGGNNWKSTTSKSYTFSGLTPNTAYTVSVRCTGSGGTSSSTNNGGSGWTQINPPTWGTCTSTISSVSLALGTNGNANTNLLQYEYSKDGSNYTTNKTFSSLTDNSNYTFYARFKNTTNGAYSARISISLWTVPILDSVSINHKSGSEHSAFEVYASTNTNSDLMEYYYRSTSGNQGWGGGGAVWSGKSGHSTHTVYVKSRNTTSGLVSSEKSVTITLWYNPVTNLSVTLSNRWFFYLAISSSFSYQGGTSNIKKYEFSIAGQAWQNKGTSNSHSRGTIDPAGSDPIAYNTNHTCKVRITDNHGRQYTASATFKTLDARCNYVNGTLREVRIIRPNGTVKLITPDLCTIIKSDGTKVNMNKIVNNDDRTEFK